LGQETFRARNYGLEDGLWIVHHEAYKRDDEYQEREQEEDRKIGKLACDCQGIVPQQLTYYLP
jgi:hypothetical protein